MSTQFNVCRICLGMNGETLNIHEFAAAIMECAPIQIALGDGFPNGICEDCLEKLQAAQQFRILCIQSDLTLKQSQLRTIEDEVIEVSCSESESSEDDDQTMARPHYRHFLSDSLLEYVPDIELKEEESINRSDSSSGSCATETNQTNYVDQTIQNVINFQDSREIASQNRESTVETVDSKLVDQISVNDQSMEITNENLVENARSSIIDSTYQKESQSNSNNGIPEINFNSEKVMPDQKSTVTKARCPEMPASTDTKSLRTRSRRELNDDSNKTNAVMTETQLALKKLGIKKLLVDDLLKNTQRKRMKLRTRIKMGVKMTKIGGRTNGVVTRQKKINGGHLGAKRKSTIVKSRKIDQR